MFRRATGSEEVIAVINAGDYDFTMEHGALQGTFRNLLTDEEETLDGRCNISAYGVKIYKRG